jgi:sugar phosphate isomerase/epimerase
MSSRRDFVKVAGAGALATTFGISKSNTLTSLTSKAERTYSLGIAGYTFNPFRKDMGKAIEILKAVNVKSITLKDFYLPYNSTRQQVDEVINKLKSNDIEVYGLGVIYLKTQQDVDNAFQYAQMAGVKMIVISPTYELLPVVEKNAMEYNIRAAIHNHGPEDKLFPDIDSIYERIKDMDPVMGICLDIGHSFRCKHDPAEMLMKFKDRIYDMHIKDEEAQVADARGMVMGRGKMNFVNLVNALNKSGYSGICSLEYEVRQDPVDFTYGIAESVGYFRGVINSVLN